MQQMVLESVRCYSGYKLVTQWPRDRNLVPRRNSDFIDKCFPRRNWPPAERVECSWRKEGAVYQEMVQRARKSLKGLRLSR